MRERGKILMKKERRGIIATVWESIGIVAIFLLLIMPNKKSIIDMILDRFGVGQNYYFGIGYATIILIGIFLLVYLFSFSAFPKEKSTKLFATISSSLMALTIISLIVFK